LSKNIKITIYKTKVLPVVLYGYETVSDIKEGTGRYLYRKRDEETRDWRGLKNELHNFYSLSGIIKSIKSRKMRWTEHEVGKGMKRSGKARRNETARKNYRARWKFLLNMVTNILIP
jgi:hypothetical protein